MAHPIYLSFAPEDAALASELAKYIESRSLIPVLGPAGEGPATESVMIVLFTDSTNRCPSILNDFKVATARRIPIVGLRIAASFLKDEIESLNPSVEWITSIVGNPNNHFPKLVDQVAVHLQGVHVAAHLDSPSTYAHDEHTEPKSEVVEPETFSSVTPGPPPAIVMPPVRSRVDEAFTVVLLDQGPDPSETIALVQELTGLDREEAGNLVESVPVNIAVADSQAEAEGQATYLSSSGARTEIRSRGSSEPAQYAAAPAFLMGPQYDVVLTSPSTNKLGLIKAVRDITGLGLAECKDLVEGPMPQSLARVNTMHEASRLRDMVYAAGASADALEATPETAPHFVRRPVPAKANAGCGVAVGCFVLIFFLFIVIGIFAE